MAWLFSLVCMVLGLVFTKFGFEHFDVTFTCFKFAIAFGIIGTVEYAICKFHNILARKYSVEYRGLEKEKS